MPEQHLDVDTVDELLQQQADLDSDAGMQASAGLLPGGPMESFVSGALSQGDWGVEARLLIVTSAGEGRRRDEAETGAPTAAQTQDDVGLRDGMVVDADGVKQWLEVRTSEYARGFPYASLVGVELPGWVGAVVAVCEGWLEDGAPELLARVEPDPAVIRDDGAVRIRTAYAATRHGIRATGVTARGRGAPVVAITSQEDTPPGMPIMGGRIGAAVHRLVGLQVPFEGPLRHPWSSLAGTWARGVLQAWDTATSRLGRVGAALLAWSMRPDVVGAQREMVRIELEKALRKRGVRPDDTDEVDRLVGAGLMDELPPVPDLSSEIVVRNRIRRRELEKVESFTAGHVLSGGRPFLRTSALAFADVSGRSRSDIVDSRRVAAWQDAGAAMWHYGLVMEPSAAATALQTLAAMPTIPSWFAESTRNFVGRVANADIDWERRPSP